MRFPSQATYFPLQGRSIQQNLSRHINSRRRTLYTGITALSAWDRIPQSDCRIDVAGRRLPTVIPRCSSSRPKISSDIAKFPTSSSLAQQIRFIVTVTQTSASETAQVTQSEAAATTSTATATNNNPHDLTITASCAARIRQLASSRPNPDSVYLRLYVDAGGCSGFQYKFLLLSEDGTATTDLDDDDEEEDGTIDPEEDIVYSVEGARLVVDQTSLELLRGSTIDYVQEMIRSSFAVVNNPQSESACGCGSSFAVKKFEANPALD